MAFTSARGTTIGDLNDVLVFVRVVELGSFSAAARHLGMPRATVSRKLARLESHLGTRLLQRTTRSLGMTDAGRRYFEQCRAGLALLAEANAAIANVQHEPTGTIRISGPADASSFLSQQITGFLRANPRVQVEMVLTDERVNLIAGRIDVAVRMGELSDSSRLQNA